MIKNKLSGIELSPLGADAVDVFETFS